MEPDRENSVGTETVLGIASLVQTSDEFFTFLDKSSPQKSAQVLDDLDAYVTEEGPFDGVIGFSEGAALAAMLTMRKSRQANLSRQIGLPFKCAIFFSGGVPADVRALERGELRLLDGTEDEELIDLPTAHIWGRNDKEYPTFGPVLHRLCKFDSRFMYIHNGGHEVPGWSDRDAVISATRIIRRVIAEALDAQ